MGLELTNEQKEQLAKPLREGQKIEAIKQCRELTGLGLKEAKEAVDALIPELGKKYPEILMKSRGGCGAAALLFCLLASALAALLC